MPTDIRADKGASVYELDEDKVLPVVTTWMGLENIALSYLSQMEKDKYPKSSLKFGM